MVSIRPRGKTYEVQYRIPYGEPKTESGLTLAQAEARKEFLEKWIPKERARLKALREEEQVKAKSVPNTEEAPVFPPYSVGELMQEVTKLYGSENWGFSSFRNNKGLIKNYINPIIGKMDIRLMSVKQWNEYFVKLMTTPEVTQRGKEHRKPKTLSNRTRQELYNLLNVALEQAVYWEWIEANPLVKVRKPKKGIANVPTWSISTAREVLLLAEQDQLPDPASTFDRNMLKLFLWLALAASMRFGEIAGLCRQFVNLGDIENNYRGAFLEIRQQLQRVEDETLEELVSRNQEVFLKFPKKTPSSKSTLILTSPKTPSSIRKVWIPPTLAKLIHETLIRQERIKAAFPDEYHDYGLVFCQNNGDPIENARMRKYWHKFLTKSGLPIVVLHSLRKTSTSIKLVITHGDIKAVQGENGHAVSQMVTDTYATIQEERRAFVPELFEKHIRGLTPYEDQREDLRAYMAEYQRLPLEKKGELWRLFSADMNPLPDEIMECVGNF